MTKTKRPKSTEARTAVAHLYDAKSDQTCAPVRRDVDAVLAAATDHGISPTTPNDDLLRDYIVPDEIGTLYILLNRKLSKYKDFTLFTSTEIKATSSVGQVRAAAYKHCGNIHCDPI